MNYILKIAIHSFKHSLTITFFVFVMIMLVDYVNVFTKGKISNFLQKNKNKQYLLSSFLGATPGCLGAFMNVSFYMQGIISIGAVTGCMIATSGDEAFVMLSMFPKRAVLLFAILFFIGVIMSYIADKLYMLIYGKKPVKCEFSGLHVNDTCRCLSLKEVILNIKNFSANRLYLLALFLSIFLLSIAGIIGPEKGWEKYTFITLILLAAYIILTVHDHYLVEHIWNHILKKHIWKIFLWTFFALFLVKFAAGGINLKELVDKNKIIVLLLAVILGIIPESGPHLIFVAMYVEGVIPFSILLASSISQDGHGMLPLFAYSLKDALFVKIFNVAVAFIIGIMLLGLNIA